MSLREDTFAQLLSFANVRAGGRYLVVDDCAGLVVGGVLERMGGQYTGSLPDILYREGADLAPLFSELKARVAF